MFGILDTSASGLYAQRTRLNIISNNLANLNSTRNFKGELEPYVRKLPVFSQGTPNDPNSGVTVSEIVEDNKTEFRYEYKPGHKDAGPDGMVKYPNVYPEREITNALVAQRAYEFNASAMEISKNMILSSLQLIA